MGLFGRIFGDVSLPLIDSGFAVDTEFIEAAREIIDEFIPIPNAIWRTLTTPTATDKWNPPKPVGTDIPVKIVFYPSNYDSKQTSQYIPDTEITTGIVKGIMYGYDFIPKQQDVVKFNGSILTLNKAKEYRPISQVIIYEMEFSI